MRATENNVNTEAVKAAHNYLMTSLMVLDLGRYNARKGLGEWEVVLPDGEVLRYYREEGHVGPDTAPEKVGARDVALVLGGKMDGKRVFFRKDRDFDWKFLVERAFSPEF